MIDNISSHSILGNMDGVERQQKKRPLLSKHYEELAKWFERVALLLLASLVVQKIFVGEVDDPVLYVSATVSLFFYFAAYRLLIKS